MKTDLIVAIDLGASLTKSFYRYQVEGQVPLEGLLTSVSAVQRITASRYELRQYVDDNTSQIAFDGDYWTVGLNARHEATLISATAPKVRHAIAKVLAVVGHILMQMAVADELDGVSIEVGVLLPLDEMRDSVELSERLAEFLHDFGFNGLRRDGMVVRQIHVLPEGYGMSRYATRFPSGVLMFGHRDISWVHIESDRFNATSSIAIADSRAFPGWGMCRLLREMSYGFKDELRAAAAIFAAGEDLKDKYLLKIVAPEDLPRLKREITEARELVWRQLWDELAYTTVRSVELVYGAGGNSFFWRHHLKQKLGSKVSFGGPLLTEMQERFGELSKSPLLYRCADCFGFWKSLLALADSRPQAEPKAVHSTVLRLEATRNVEAS
ncbi:MAG: hypothetical protein WCD18_01245 [Thermosynechococcaceae cyanobacterium]